MQSSSRLFPVSLMATELAGDLHEDVYQLNPGISTDPTLRIAVTRVTDPAWEGDRSPVVLLHAEFKNRRQWLTPQGEGFAGLLARFGFDVWLPEMRGHGLSPAHRDWALNHCSLLAEEDLPPVQRFVMEQSGKAPVWLGRGLGGRLLAHGLVHSRLMRRYTCGAVFIEPGNPSRHWTEDELTLLERWALPRRERVSGSQRDWGTEDEPARLLRDIYRQQRRYRRGKKHPVYDGLRTIRCPALVVSLGDEDDEVRNFSGQLGGQSRQTLLSHRYLNDRPGMSRDDLLPAVQNDIRAWLDEVRTRQQATPLPEAL